jgi:hypothetical protein
MAIQGLRDTANWQADQRPKDWLETVLLLWPNGKAPLTALRTAMKKKPTTDPEYSWFSKNFNDQRMALNGSFTNVVTTLTVVSGASQLKKNHILLVEHTGEQVRVSADPVNDVDIVVVRAFAGTTNTAINSATSGTNPYLLVVGTAHEEGSLAPTPISYNPTKFNNYTQIFRNTLGMTRTAQQTKLRTGSQVAESKRECLELHTVEMERASWLGEKSEDLTGADPRRSTLGLIPFIRVNSPTENKIDWQTFNSGAKNYTTALMALEVLFRWGSSEKMGYCGNTAMLTLQNLCRLNSDGFKIETNQKEFGMNVSRLITPFGELVLKTHPLFNRITGGVNTTAYYGLDSTIVVCDMDKMVWRPLQNSDTKYESGYETPGQDGMLSGYLTEGGYEFHNPEAWGYIQKFVGAAAG